MTRIQIRRDTSANWATYNPILADGEFALETDTRKLKIGNGEQPYNDLSYQDSGTSDYTQLTNKPQINGIELTGNKNGNDLGLANESEIEELGNELNQLANDVTNLDTNKQDKLVAGTNITIEGNVISATGGGEIPTNMVTTDTDQTITGQKNLQSPKVDYLYSANTGSILIYDNANGTGVGNQNRPTTMSGLASSNKYGITLQSARIEVGNYSSCREIYIGANQQTTGYEGSVTIRAGDGSTTGTINLNAGSVLINGSPINTTISNIANYSINTLLKIDTTGLSTTVNSGATQNLLDLVSLTGSGTNIVTVANILATNYNLTGGILKLPYMPTIDTKYTNSYCDYTIDVRLTGTIGGSVNTAREFNIELQRANDSSIVETHNVTKTNTNDLTGKGVSFSTFTNTSSDPFISEGLKLILNNTSGQTVTITGVTLLVKGRTY